MLLLNKCSGFPVSFHWADCIVAHSIAYSCSLWYGTVCYGVVWYSTVWCSMVWSGTVLYGVGWYCAVRYGMVYICGYISYFVPVTLNQKAFFMLVGLFIL